MDGSSRMVLHNTNLQDTYALTMDYENQVLYWADFSRSRIESSNVDGSNRRTLTTSLRNPYCMVYFNGSLYWGDFSYNRVRTGTVSSLGSGRNIGGYFSYEVYGIDVISGDRQPQGNL